jgi:hypothetical protein
MGELAPGVTRFRFRKSVDVEAEADRLARLYRDVGLAFAEAIADYDSLLPLLRQRIDSLGAYPERYASCLHIMGRDEEAVVFVNSFLATHHSYFESFATPFLEMLGQRNPDTRGGAERHSRL